MFFSYPLRQSIKPILIHGAQSPLTGALAKALLEKNIPFQYFTGAGGFARENRSSIILTPTTIKALGRFGVELSTIRKLATPITQIDFYSSKAGVISKSHFLAGEHFSISEKDLASLIPFPSEYKPEFDPDAHYIVQNDNHFIALSGEKKMEGSLVIDCGGGYSRFREDVKCKPPEMKENSTTTTWRWLEKVSIKNPEYHMLDEISGVLVKLPLNNKQTACHLKVDLPVFMPDFSFCSLKRFLKKSGRVDLLAQAVNQGEAYDVRADYDFANPFSVASKKRYVLVKDWSLGTLPIHRNVSSTLDGIRDLAELLASQRNILKALQDFETNLNSRAQEPEPWLSSPHYSLRK